MLRYILKRVLFFIPTLLVITFFAFILSKTAPGDPVNLKLKGAESASSGQLAEKQAGEKAYYEMSEKLGYNLPAFYFMPSSKAYPDTLYKIIKKDERENLSELIGKYGNWEQISPYYHSVKTFDIETSKIKKDSTNFVEMTAVRESVTKLLGMADDGGIEFLLDQINTNVAAVKSIKIDSATTNDVQILAVLQPFADDMTGKYQAIKDNPTPGKKFMPALHWYGIRNQYHRWLFGDMPWFGKNENAKNSTYGAFRLDFGESIIDGRPVMSKIKDAIFWTIILNLIAVFISYIIAIPLGVLNAVKRDTTLDRISTVSLFVLYSLPTFWIATLIVVFLTTSTYGEWMDIFPTHGTGSNDLPENAGMFARMMDSLPYMIAPVFCMTFGSFAYLSRQMRGGMLSVLKQDFIRTAKAKGLTEKVIIWKHAFRNSLIPIITILAGLLPRMIAGSVVIETIFQIPGMGDLAIKSITRRDYPVVFTIMIFAAILTMTGVLVSDILYALVDPRISFSKKS